MSDLGSRGVTTFRTRLFTTKELAEAYQVMCADADAAVSRPVRETTLHEMRLLGDVPAEWIVVIPE